QFVADRVEGFIPLAWHVLVGRAVVAHRMRQAALLFEVVITPAEQFAASVLRKELRRRAQRGQFPRAGLGAIFAELELRRLLGLWPRARHAGEPARLVLPPQFPHRGRNRTL